MQCSPHARCRQLSFAGRRDLHACRKRVLVRERQQRWFALRILVIRKSCFALHAATQDPYGRADDIRRNVRMKYLKLLARAAKDPLTHAVESPALAKLGSSASLAVSTPEVPAVLKTDQTDQEPSPDPDPETELAKLGPSTSLAVPTPDGPAILNAKVRVFLRSASFLSSEPSAPDVVLEVDQVQYTDAFMSKYVLGGGGELPEFPRFLGDLELRKVRGKGRGLFALQDFEPGELLIAEAAIGGVHLPSEKELFLTDVMAACSRSAYANGMIRLLISNDIPTMSTIQESKFEMKQLSALAVRRIVLTRTTFGTLIELQDGQVVRKPFAGVWPLLALLNHSCDSSISMRPIGETMFVRATKKIKAGEELVFCYCDPCMPVEARHKELMFTCTCKYCNLELSEKDMSKDRKLFLKLLDDYKLGTVKAKKSLRKIVKGVEKKLSKNGSKGGEGADEGKEWLRSTFWKAYELGISCDIINFDEAIKTHLQCTPGQLGVLKSLIKAMRDGKAAASTANLEKLGLATMLAYPGLDSQAAAALLNIL